MTERVTALGPNPVKPEIIAAWLAHGELAGAAA